MRKIPETLTEKELRDILLKIENPELKLAYALGFYQCMRVSEVVNLKPEHIDKNRKLIMIKEAKGKKDRNIPIAPEIMKGLKHIPIVLSTRSLQRNFKHHSTTIVGKDLHFHSLRHSGATYYLNVKKWSTRQVQVFLGHSRIATTEIYTHVTPQDLIDKMWGEA